MKIAFVLLFLLSSLGYSVERIESPGICSFYLEKSKELSCEKTNYLTRFGYKYCQLFIKKEKSYTPYAQGVLSKIRSCLVNHLSKIENLSCDNVTEIAASSHIDCYINNDFCKLSPKDGLTTFWYIKSELPDPLFRSTIIKIADRCRLLRFKSN